MWRRSTASALLGLGLLGLTAPGQPPAPPAAGKKPADKKPTDPVEALIEAALANDPDVRMARAKMQLAEAELAKARQQVAVKVVTLSTEITELKRGVAAAERNYRMVEEQHKRAVVGMTEVLAVRDKLETAQGHLTRLESELKLLTGGPPGGAAAPPADEVHRAAGAQNVGCSVCHAGPVHLSAAAGMRWLALAQHPSPDAASALGAAAQANFAAWVRPAVVQGPVADRIRAALDRPVRLGVKGEKLTVEKALDAIRKNAGLDVPIRRGDPFLGNEGKPDSVDVLTSEGEELPVGAWLQMIEDNTGCRFYIREYGLLFTEMKRAPEDAVPLIDFWKQKPAAKAAESKK